MNSQPSTVSPLVRFRATLSPTEFRHELREYLLTHPSVTLSQVASVLGLTRQRIAEMVGRLDRTTSSYSARPAPKKEKAQSLMIELECRVQSGQPAASACSALGLSLHAAMKLGFRSLAYRPVHGSQARLAAGCNCWRCRRAAGIALPRGRRMDERKRARIIDLLAWTDPDTGDVLTQAEVARRAGVGQSVVSRVLRQALAAGEDDASES